MDRTPRDHGARPEEAAGLVVPSHRVVGEVAVGQEPSVTDGGLIAELDGDVPDPVLDGVQRDPGIRRQVARKFPAGVTPHQLPGQRAGPGGWLVRQAGPKPLAHCGVAGAVREPAVGHGGILSKPGRVQRPLDDFRGDENCHEFDGC
jgi:hypothetical protein